jgi:hypothetical protein
LRGHVCTTLKIALIIVYLLLTEVNSISIHIVSSIYIYTFWFTLLLSAPLIIIEGFIHYCIGRISFISFLMEAISFVEGNKLHQKAAGLHKCSHMIFPEHNLTVSLTYPGLSSHYAVNCKERWNVLTELFASLLIILL